MPPPLILIVDDNPENLTVIGELLQGHCAVRVANGGLRALQLARQLPQPDLVLLDVMMPDMDGFEVLRQLQAQPTTARLPVVLLTALTAPGDIASGRQLGAVDYLTKPVDPQRLLACVQQQLQAVGQAVAAPELIGPVQAAPMPIAAPVWPAALARTWARVGLLAGPLGWQVPGLLLNPTGVQDPLALARLAARQAAAQVHEHWDGSGYPDGLAGEAIPPLARLWAVAEAVATLTLPDDQEDLPLVGRALKTVQTIVAERGRRFDPAVVDALLQRQQAVLAWLPADQTADAARHD